MTNVEMQIYADNINSKGFTEKITKLCKDLDIPCLSNTYSDQIMILYDHGLALFYIEEKEGNNNPYIFVTITIVGTMRELTSFIIDTLRLLGHIGLKYEIDNLSVE